MLQRVAVCCRVLPCVTVCCSVLQGHDSFVSDGDSPHAYEERQFVMQLQCVAVCCSVLQCVALCCSMLQYVAVRWQGHDSFISDGDLPRTYEECQIVLKLQPAIADCTRTATHCSTLQHTATHCDTLQHLCAFGHQ